MYNIPWLHNEQKLWCVSQFIKKIRTTYKYYTTYMYVTKYISTRHYIVHTSKPIFNYKNCVTIEHVK